LKVQHRLLSSTRSIYAPNPFEQHPTKSHVESKSRDGIQQKVTQMIRTGEPKYEIWKTKFKIFLKNKEVQIYSFPNHWTIKRTQKQSRRPTETNLPLTMKIRQHMNRTVDDPTQITQQPDHSPNHSTFLIFYVIFFRIFLTKNIIFFLI